MRVRHDKPQRISTADSPNQQVGVIESETTAEGYDDR
jgi:hypothetical protein